MKEAVMINGNAYKSFSAACQAYSLHHTQVKRLMAKDGIDMESAINILKMRKPQTKIFLGKNWTAHEGFNEVSGDFISPDGQHFNSFREMCLSYGQEPSTVTARLKKMSLDKALKKRGQFKSILVLNSDGSQSLMSVTELKTKCYDVKNDRQAVDEKKLIQLAESGQTISVTAINDLVQDSLKAKDNLISYEGKKYFASEIYKKTLNQNTGCNTRTLASFRQRIRQGMNADEAIKHTPQIRRKKLPPVVLKQWNYNEETGLFIAPNGKGYRSRSAMCKDYRQNMGTVTRRLAYGFDLEIALTGEKYQRIYQTDPNANISMFGYYFDKQLWSLDGVNFYPNMTAMCHSVHMSATWWRVGIEHRYAKEYLIAKASLFPIKEVMYHGTSYKSANLLVRDYQTAVQTVAYRMLKNNCDFETALDSIIASQEKENF